MGAHALDLRERGGLATLDGPGQAPLLPAGVGSDEPLAHRLAERGRQDAQGAVGRVGARPAAHDGRPPAAHVGAGDLAQAQLAQVRHDEAVGVAGPVGAGARFPGEPRLGDPGDDPVREDRPVGLVGTLSGLHLAEEDGCLALGCEAPRPALPALVPIDAPGPSGALGLVAEVGHLSDPSTALWTALDDGTSPETASGRADSNRRPPPPKGAECPSCGVVSSGGESSESASLEGSEGDDDPEEHDAGQHDPANGRRHSERHLDGNDVPGDPWAAAWSDYLAGRA